jgi:hypothetical protein
MGSGTRLAVTSSQDALFSASKGGLTVVLGLYFAKFFQMEAALNSFIRVSLLSLVLAAPAFAEKLVDPSTVAPEYREAAEKRRAEQVRQSDCAKKAAQEKVLPRDRTAFLLHCLEADADTGAR